MCAMDIEWEEPPKTATINGKGPGKYADLVKTLEENPGRWAKVPSLTGQPRTEGSAKGLAQNLRRGNIKGFEEVGRWESAFEGTEVWVRYIEPVEGEAPAPRPALSLGNGELAPKVRQWAKRQGIGISDHGRIPEAVTLSYLEEHPEDRPTISRGE